MKGFFLANWVSVSLLIFIFGITPSFAADSAEALYKEGKYKEAEEAFRKSDMENPKDVSFRYNRGCAAFQAGDVEGSKASFDSVLKRGKDKDILARSAYNLGNAALQTSDFEGAVEAYKKALALNPADADAKYNLQLALWKKAQAETQKQENKEGEKQEGKDLKDSKDQQGKDQQGKDQNQSKDQKSEQEGDKSQQGDQNKEQQEQAKNQEKQDQNSKDQNGQNGNPQQSENQQQEQAGKQDQAQAQNQPEDKGAAGEEKKDEQPQNLEGKLEAAEEQPPGPRKEAEPKQSAMVMEQRRANALLDNVKEVPIMQFQKKEKGEKGTPASGKSW